MMHESPTTNIAEIAGELRRLSGALDALSGDAGRTPPAGGGEAELAQAAERHLLLRRRRDTIFPPDIFAEPGWDMMLDLFVAEARGRPMAVSAACLASACSPATALRHIASLERLGLVERHEGAGGGREVYLRLTPESREMLRRSLAAERT